MDRITVLLRLDAAMAEAAGLELQPQVRAAFNLLFDSIGDELEQKFPLFGDFLDAQEKAVQVSSQERSM